MENNNQKSTFTRRNFVKKAGIAAAAFTIIPRYVLGGKGFIAPSDQLSVAGIGVGGRGAANINGMFQTGKAVISHLCDVDAQRASEIFLKYPKAKRFEDWREMLDKQHKNIDAIVVSTPDHNHAVATLAAMHLGKHVYVEKPLTHDLYEARLLTKAAKKYKVVTQMGNQGSSNDGTRLMREWFEAGLIGDVHTVYTWTNRPVWPQGVDWPAKASLPKGLNWDLWLGTAPNTDFREKIVPFNWRGWWEYGTGALGDMGCHLLEVVFNTLGITYPNSVQASVGSVYAEEFKRGYFPDSCPPSSHVTLRYPASKRNSIPTELHWMDGGIVPSRPIELLNGEIFGDGGNGTLFVGTKGKMMCDTYSANPRLLPLSKNEQINVKPVYERVPNGAEGHHNQFVEACIAGYGNKKLSAPFEIAGPLTEALLMANLAVRGFDLKKEIDGKTLFPGRDITLFWDNELMKITNFEEVNQFVKRNYREGWDLKL